MTDTPPVTEQLRHSPYTAAANRFLAADMIEELAAIVRDLAAADVPVDASSSCCFCDCWPWSETGDGRGSDVALHDPDCLWRRVVEWTKEHPA